MTEDWPIKWRGSWIRWAPLPARTDVWDGAAGTDGPDGFACFRHDFTLRDPGPARCRITADSRYVLWVNGEYLGRGPVRSEPAHLSFDQYDLTEQLRPGRNTVAVLVRHYGSPVLYWRPAMRVGDLGAGGLLFEAEVDEAGAPTVVATGEGWTARWDETPLPGPRPYGGPPPNEAVDANRRPPGWHLPDDDAAAHWDAAAVIAPAGLGIVDRRPPTDPYPRLALRPIPPLAETVVAPARIVARRPAAPTTTGTAEEDFAADAATHAAAEQPTDTSTIAPGHSIVYDFGQEVNGHPILDVEADPGAVIDITVAEDVDADGRPILVRPWHLRVATSETNGGPHHAEAFEPGGFRYVQATVRNAPVRSLAVTARQRVYPRPPGPSFASSDPVLNEIWQAGVRTLDLCSTDAYLDCPSREVRAWLGDAYIHTLVSLVANPDTGLARWNARLHAQAPRPDGFFPMTAASDFSHFAVTIPDYALHWIATVARLALYTGDLALAEELWPAIGGVLNTYERYRAPNGLLAAIPGWVFIDWAQTERGLHTAVLDGLLAMALQDAAWLARLLGDEGSAQRYEARRAQTAAAFESYWDDDAGVYRDALHDNDDGGDGRPGNRVSQHTNAVAILGGCAPEERWPGMLDRVLDEARLVDTISPADSANILDQFDAPPPPFDAATNVVAAQPFFRHWVHQAVMTAGRPDLLPGLLRRWEPLLAIGNGTLPELWTHNPGTSSRCHAWSATPTYDLTTHVLGLRPASPGWSRITVHPHLGGLDHVEGVVPTPHGLLTASFRADGAARVEAPAGTVATVTWQGRRETFTGMWQAAPNR